MGICEAVTARGITCNRPTKEKYCGIHQPLFQEYKDYLGEEAALLRMSKALTYRQQGHDVTALNTRLKVVEKKD